MVDGLAMWKAAVSREGQNPFLREVVGILDTPGGPLKAMEMMLKHCLARDLESGVYKPGHGVDVVQAAHALNRQ